MSNSKPKPLSMNRRQTLITLFFGGILAYVLWNTPSLSFLTYPLRLFVTYIHEASHSLAAIITGGQVLQFTVSPDGSGLATTMGGSRLLILPAGYLGAALFGSGLFYFLYRHPHPRTYSAVIGAFLVIFTALYARPDASGAWTAMVVGVLFGLLLIAMAWKATPHLTQLLLTILALITATNAILDINSLTRIGGDCSGKDTITDAVQMACSFGLSSGFWAIIWMGVAVVMLG
ncbi:MAG TPA: M50 family metallopeptidase, partial [Aggregatilineales bacterium]|nr:M50 family metallopeptidase [Aggregatilineales bacterium]